MVFATGGFGPGTLSQLAGDGIGGFALTLPHG